MADTSLLEISSRSVRVAPSTSDSSVSIVGAFNAPIGLGESARRQSLAFKAAGATVANHSVQISSQGTVPFGPLEPGPPRYPWQIFHVNPPELLHPQGLGRFMQSDTKVYRVGYWAWELPVFPGAWVPALDLVDEVWVPSSFIANGLADVTKKPVHVVPHAVPDNNRDKRASRQALGLPSDAFIFLSVFDTDSFPARKNPAAVLAAFLDAFPADSGTSQPLLVLKMHGSSHRRGPEFRALMDLANGSRNICVIDRVFSEEEILRLQAACDVFVSLHRSEGFGLNIAECMAAGRVVITTDFSGNVDFANATNAKVIPYAMRRVEMNEYHYSRGQWWAEPDHDAAVAAMRWVVDHPSVADLIAERARRSMMLNYSFQAVGRKALNLLSSKRHMVPARRIPLPPPFRASTLGRNDPCFCGSGKKYKNCHGAIA